MRITIDDVRKAGICVAGARWWFPAHGIPFAQFLKEGVEAEELLAKGDDWARVVVESKKQREATNG